MRPQDLLASYILLASLVKGSVNLISRAGSTLTYNVYPNNRTDNGDEQRINSTLNGYGIDLTKIYFSKSTLPEIGVLYWEVNITSDQALQLNKSSDVSISKYFSSLDQSLSNSKVAGVYTSCKNTKTCINPFSSGEFTELPSRVIYKRDDGLTQQTPLPARDEMVFISQASSVPLSSLGGKYVYDKSAGRDALVYVVDTGAYLSHPVNLALSTKVLLLPNTQACRNSPTAPTLGSRLLGYTRGPISPVLRRTITHGVMALLC